MLPSVVIAAATSGTLWSFLGGIISGVGHLLAAVFVVGAGGKLAFHLFGDRHALMIGTLLLLMIPAAFILAPGTITHFLQHP